MKTILAFGDNLTWGFDVKTGRRLDYEDRWSTVLERGLGDAARVIAEGLGGRTTAFDDYTGLPDRNGARILPTSLGTHTPLDAIILMLGNSELRSYIGNAVGAAHGMKRLIEVIRTYPYDSPYVAPSILVVAPPLLVATKHPDLGPMFKGGVEESERLAEYYERLSWDAGVTYFDAATVAKTDPLDGAHLDAANTRALGMALVPVMKQVLKLE
jgi:lysophospholipase L1-like esterase